MSNYRTNKVFTATSGSTIVDSRSGSTIVFEKDKAILAIIIIPTIPKIKIFFIKSDHFLLELLHNYQIL